MMGLLVLSVLGCYFVLSIYIVSRAVKYTQRRFSRGWVGGFFAGLVMCGLVFWDAIPTWYTHYHLCATEAGLKVYQTPEEWAEKNPEGYQKARAATQRVVAKRSNNSSEIIHNWTEYASGLELETYNSRRRNYAFNTGIVWERVSDKVTGEVLFEVIDFHSGAGTKSLAIGASSLADYKFWTVTGRCARAYPSLSDRFKYNGKNFSDYLITMEGWNKK